MAAVAIRVIALFVLAMPETFWRLLACPAF
jgi:hypothetical protein